MKRICVLGTDPDARGGIATVIKAFYNDIHYSDYQFKYIISHKDVNPIYKLLIGLKAAIQLFFECRAHEIDLIHMHAADGASFTRARLYIFIASIFQVPIICHIHTASWEDFYSKSSLHRKKIIKKTYLKCAALIALSEEWKNNLSQVVPENKIYILENFIPIIRQHYIPNLNNKRVLFMSRFEPVKGTDDLPFIIQHTLRVIPDAIFEICGDGSSLTKFQKACNALRINHKNIAIRGWIDSQERNKLLSESSIFLLPTYAEGMPMSILEAIGFHLPIVTSPVGGIPQIVQSGKNGILCEPGNIQEFSNAIIRILSDSTLFDKMVNENKFFCKTHSLDMYAKKLHTVYHNILESKNSKNED